MRVTIIGPGNMGRGIATRLLAGAHTVMLVGEDREQAEALARELASQATGDGRVSAASSAEDAIPESEVVILAMPFASNLAVAEQNARLLGGRVVVDISNPLNERYDGLVTEGGPSAAERIRDATGADASVVKAFNTTFAPTLVAGDVAGQPLDVFIAGDDTEANERVAELARSGGMRPITVGGLERARQLEALGFLGISIQEPLGTGFQSGWKLVMPEGAGDEAGQRSKGFPREAVVGAVEPEAVGQVLAELEAAGLAGGRVQTIAGPESAHRIRGTMEEGGRLVEFLFGFEIEHTRRHLGELEAGHTLVAARVEDDTQADRVGEVLARHGGHFVNYYSRWTTRRLVP